MKEDIQGVCLRQRLLLRPSEAATLMGISRSRAYELIAAGTIPSMRLGTSVRVPLDRLRTWIDQQCKVPSIIQPDDHTDGRRTP